MTPFKKIKIMKTSNLKLFIFLRDYLFNLQYFLSSKQQQQQQHFIMNLIQQQR